MNSETTKSMSATTKQQQPNQTARPVKTCTQCKRVETGENPVKCPIGPQWAVCLECLNSQLQRMTNFKQSRPRIYPEIHHIIDGLYLGNQDAAIDKQTIDQYQIRAVCACGSYLMTPFEGKKMEGKFQDVKYMKHGIADHYEQKIQHLFDRNCDWIQQQLKQGRHVLVHCAAGVSRSASFVIAYLMKKKGMLFRDAYQYVKQRRNVIKPNSGFEKQLQNYGKSIFESKLEQQKQQEQQRQYQQLLDSQKQQP